MRPLRLAMEGFMAYRKAVEIDFSDADLFVLSGPTGSGKSSVIDGMIFALYGAIPRLGDLRSVAPVISMLSDRARVSFRFRVGDRELVATRLVERRRAGATTTEARLEEGSEVLASGAAEVTAAVEEVLGLTFGHFIKAVVIPQGAFAAFLTDPPRDRQALLRALLDLELFDRVKVLANEMASAGKARVAEIDAALAQIPEPEASEIEQAQIRLTALRQASGELATRLEQIAEVGSDRERLSERLGRLREAVSSLEAVRLPADLAGHAEEARLVETEVAAAEQAVAAARAELTAAREARAGLPDPGLLASWRDQHREMARLEAGRAALGLETLTAEVGSATERRDLAVSAVEVVRREAAAHSLRQGLEVGDPCPVCRRPLGEEHLAGEPPPELARAEQDLAAAEVSLAGARDRLARGRGQAEEMETRLRELTRSLAEAPSVEEVDARLEEVVAATARAGEAERSLEAAEKTLSSVRERAVAMAKAAAGHRAALTAARDRVAAEEPPSPQDDVVVSWQRFEAWREQRLALRRGEVAEVTENLQARVEELTRLEAALAEWLSDLGVPVADSPATALALELERANAGVEAMEKARRDAARMRLRRQEAAGETTVASELGRHLRSNNFEAWVMEEALQTLVDGANQLLADLAAGAYSLAVRDSQFEIVDHRNADLIRPSRSLSGGETFIVALALSLSMAERLAELSGSPNRLDSIFLDEGFGALDPESLDVVATVLDELVGRGRTVGVVTHVRELADRIPVRFEITKEPETATIRKVVA